MREPKIGDVRIPSDGLPHATKIQALTENGWLDLKSIAAVEWTVAARDPAKCTLTLTMPIADIMVEAERVLLSQYKDDPEVAVTDRQVDEGWFAWTNTPAEEGSLERLRAAYRAMRLADEKV